MHKWKGDGEKVRLLEKAQSKDERERKALACYGLYLPGIGETWLRFVDGRRVSNVTTQFLGYCTDKLAEAGKEALLLIWDNASWNKSKEVSNWIAAHNSEVKANGSEAGVSIVACLLPKKSPWLNPIEPKWVHSKQDIGFLSAPRHDTESCS